MNTPNSLAITKEIIKKYVSIGSKSVLEHDAETLAKAYGIPVAKSAVATNESQAVTFLKKLGGSVVMKVVSPDVLHKTDFGAVQVNINTPSQARSAYRQIRRNVLKKNKKAEIMGILVQKMVPRGKEFVVGAIRDPQFGPTVMFGLGGIYVEIFEDVSFRLAPVSEKEAEAMMYELKSSVLFTGFRGADPLDTVSVSRVIRAVGDMMLDNEQIRSIDINPLFVFPSGAIASDVRIVL